MGCAHPVQPHSFFLLGMGGAERQQNKEALIGVYHLLQIFVPVCYNPHGIITREDRRETADEQKTTALGLGITGVNGPARFYHSSSPACRGLVGKLSRQP